MPSIDLDLKFDETRSPLQIVSARRRHWHVDATSTSLYKGLTCRGRSLGCVRIHELQIPGVQLQACVHAVHGTYTTYARKFRIVIAIDIDVPALLTFHAYTSTPYMCMHMHDRMPGAFPTIHNACKPQWPYSYACAHARINVHALPRTSPDPPLLNRLRTRLLSCVNVVRIQ